MVGVGLMRRGVNTHVADGTFIKPGTQYFMDWGTRIVDYGQHFHGIHREYCSYCEQPTRLYDINCGCWDCKVKWSSPC